MHSKENFVSATLEARAPCVTGGWGHKADIYSNMPKSQLRAGYFEHMPQIHGKGSIRRALFLVKDPPRFQFAKIQIVGVAGCLNIRG